MALPRDCPGGTVTPALGTEAAEPKTKSKQQEGAVIWEPRDSKEGSGQWEAPPAACRGTAGWDRRAPRHVEGSSSHSCQLSVPPRREHTLLLIASSTEPGSGA